MLNGKNFAFKKTNASRLKICASGTAVKVKSTINIGIDRREGKGFTVKICGRNNGLFDILLHTYKVLESKKLSSFDVSMQGRWLCLTTR